MGLNEASGRAAEPSREETDQPTKETQTSREQLQQAEGGGKEGKMMMGLGVREREGGEKSGGIIDGRTGL